MLLIKRQVSVCYISGMNLRLQRQAAGISQKGLCDLIRAATGLEITQMQISRWENSFEFGVEPVIAYAIKKILS